MTRTEFIEAYAARSNKTAEYARIGILDMGDDWKMIALPCACGEDGCEGWAMVGIEQVLHQLAFCSPDKLREAYCEIIRPDNIA